MSLIDILCLHHPKDSEKSSIRALGSTELNSIFESFVNRLSRNHVTTKKELARSLFGANINSITNWCGHNPEYPEGHPIPLRALDLCLQALKEKRTPSHVDLIKTIRTLQCGRVAKQVKALTELTPEAAKLCGAHAADGSLYLQQNRGPTTSLWELGDQDLENIRAARGWISKLFNVQLQIKQKGNMHLMRSDMQIIPRYLIQIFDFPTGEKSHTVQEPRILYSPTDPRLLEQPSVAERWSLRLKFAKETVNFDGHSTITGGIPSVGLGSRSQKLRQNLCEIFGHFGVAFRNYDSNDVMLTTSTEQSRRAYKIGLFRGRKRIKLRNSLCR